MTARALLPIVVLISVVSDAAAQINMPDPSQIAGKAIPAPDLATGTITVRVVREALGNNVAAQDVRVTVAGTSKTAKTDAEGRAEFPGLPAGAEARAESVVDGEKLVSDPFAVPTSGGLRVILVAGLARAAERRRQEAAAALAAPPVRGGVVFGPGTRVVMQFQDDTLRVFYALNILNNARTRVDIGGPLILDLPTEAAGATLVEGSSPSATLNGTRLTVRGPFAPGATDVTVEFQLNYGSANVTVAQKWPAPVQELAVALQKVGSLSMTSPQFGTTGDVKAEDGSTFILATGPALPAGATLTLQLSNLPIHSTTPKWIALGLAVGLLVVGAWLAYRVKSPDEAARTRLLERRDALLAELVRLEQRQSKGDSRDEAIRRRLMGELERVFGQLDEGPQGGGEDIAA